MITGSLPGVNRGCPLVSGETSCICPPSGMGILSTQFCAYNPLGPDTVIVSIIQVETSKGMSLIPVHSTYGTHACTAARGFWLLQRPRTTDGSEKKESLLCKWASHLPLPAPPPSHPMSSHDSLQLAGLGATHAPLVPCLLAPLTCHPNPPAVSHLCQGAGWGGTRVENWGKGWCSDGKRFYAFLYL